MEIVKCHAPQTTWRRMTEDDLNSTSASCCCSAAADDALMMMIMIMMIMMMMMNVMLSERPVTGRLDYIVWHQDLVTSAPVSDLELFQVPDEGLFLAAAAFDHREPSRKQQSTLFKWNDDHFTVYQSLYTLGAYCWQHFLIRKRVILFTTSFSIRFLSYLRCPAVKIAIIKLIPELYQIGF